MIAPASRLLRTARALSFPVLLAQAALLASCAGTEDLDPDAVERVVVESPTAGTADPSAPDALARAEQALAEAEAAWRAGDPLTALAIANKAVREGVPPELKPRFREIQARARGAVLAAKVVRVRVVPLRDVVASGDPVPVRIFIQNLTPTPLRAPRTSPGSSDSLIVLELRREDLDVFGNRRTSEFTLRAPIPDDLVVPPGGEREFQVSIAADLVALEHEGLTVVRIGGTFRPVEIRVGETELFDAVPIESAPVRVLARGYEPLAVDPLESLKKAVARRSPVHVMTCAELLAPADRDAARAVLREAEAKDRELAPFLRTVLERLDEVDRPPPQRNSADAAGPPRAGSSR